MREYNQCINNSDCGVPLDRQTHLNLVSNESKFQLKTIKKVKRAIWLNFLLFYCYLKIVKYSQQDTAMEGRYDTQDYNIQHKDTQHNDIPHNCK